MIKITWDDIDKLIKKLVKEIKKSKITYDYIFGIPKGGLIPAVMLAHHLNIPLLTSAYDADLVRKKSKLLTVDDMVDSGQTIQPFTYRLSKQDTCCLYKRYSCVVPITWVGQVITNDQWLCFPWETKAVKQIPERNIL